MDHAPASSIGGGYFRIDYFCSMHYSLLHRFTGHTGSVYSLESGPDPATFFSGAGDKVVAKWNLNLKSDGDLVARAMDAVYSLQYLKAANQLLIGQGKGGIHVIDLAGNKELRLLQLHEGPVFNLVQSGVHNLLLSLGGDGTMVGLNTADFSVLQRLRITDKKLRSASLNPQENLALIAAGDGSIVLLELPSLKIMDRFQAHKPDFSVNTVCFSPDGNYFLSGSRDAHLHLYETASRKLIASIPAHNYAIYAISFDPSGLFFATASRDKTLKLWDFNRMEVVERLEANDGKGHINSVNTLLWLSGGTLLSAGDDRAIQAWKPE